MSMTDSNFKATVELGDKKITIEGPREFVEEQISRLTEASASKRTSRNYCTLDLYRDDSDTVSERELIEEKRPKGHLETVAVLAFALASTGTPEFTEEDIRRAYLRARVRPPKSVAQALRDAKNRMDYIESGSKRGIYRLSHHGDQIGRAHLSTPVHRSARMPPSAGKKT